MSAAPPSFEEVCTQALKLPCSPVLMPRLVAAMRNEESTSSDIERIIQMDSALATATLRLANSAFYAGSEPVLDLSEAILRLGQNEIYRLASLILVSRWEAMHSKHLRGEPGDYSRHSLCTALAAEVLAEASGRVEPPIAYTAGLICDVGKLVLAYVCAPFFPVVAERCKKEGCMWIEAEKAVLGYDNCEVGAKLLRLWRFPDVFPQAIEFQAEPTRAPSEALPLVAHLHAAKYLAVAMGPGVREEGFLFAVHGGFLNEWGFTPEFLEEAMVEVCRRAVDRLGDKLSMGQIFG